MKFFSSTHPLRYSKITTYFNCELRFNGSFLRDNLPRIQDVPHVINIDDKQSNETLWLSLFTTINMAE